VDQPTSASVIKPWWIALLALPLLLALVLVTVRPANEPVIRLPDGTEFELAMVAFTNSYSYNQVNGPAWMRRHAKLIPDFIGKRFLSRGGGIGLGSSPETNLMVVIESRSPGNAGSSLVWLRVADDDDNNFDGNSNNGVLSSGSNRAMVWRITTFPRRTRHIRLTGLVFQTDGTWTNIGPFKIENPRFAEYPQWKAGPVPQAIQSKGLTASLDRFVSTWPSSPLKGAADSEHGPRATRLEFTFEVEGTPAAEYRVHSVTFSDATGNQWSPFLSPFHQNGPGWTTNGVAEFVGALWPGEDAWRIELQALRSADFATNDLWSVPPIPLPNPATHDDLTHQLQLDGLSVQVANILAPGVEVTNSWRWIVRYWGQEKSVYGLGVKLDGVMNQRRLVVVAAKDQAGNEFKLVEHRGADYPEQAIFLQAPPDATELHLQLAFPELREFEFLARPEFVDPSVNRRR